MAAGDKALKTRIDEIRNAVNAARSRWGLAQDSPTVTVGNTIKATDINNLATKLNEAKSKSGWTGGITTVAQEAVITDITGNLISQANSIKNYCVCHGNCSGSCTGSCSGSCSGTCRDTCTRTCRTDCDHNCGDRSR